MFGRRILTGPTLLPTRVSFDGMPRYKAAGVTLDPTLFPAAASSPTTLQDSSIIPAGIQYLRFGQVCCKVTTPQVSTVTIGGTPTGGTFLINVTAQGSLQATAAIPFNATTAAVQSALQALGNVGTNNVTVGGTAGSQYTVTFTGTVGVPVITADGTNLTGGTSPSASASLLPASGTLANTGKFGPFDPNATDGRQTLTRGESFVLDETFVYQPFGTILPGPNEIRGGFIDGGAIWLQRVLQCGAGAPSLATGPTLAAFLAAFPSFQIVEN